MRILVTGGAGYLGAEVCAQALTRGHDVVATEHRKPAPHGRPFRLDIRDGDAVDRAFLRCGPDVVVHTAYAQTGQEMHDTIVRGTHNVATASARVGARLVHLSTDLVFDGEQGAPYDESAEPRPVMDYGAAKLDAERVADGALVLRTSLLYGNPGGPQEALAHRGDVRFHTDEIRCPTLVAELATAILDLAGVDVVGPLHLAAPDAVSRQEFASLLRGGPVPGAPTPPGRARNVALDSSRGAALLGRQLTGVLTAMGRSA